MKCKIINCDNHFIIMRCNTGNFDKINGNSSVLEYDYCPFCGNELINPDSYNTKMGLKDKCND